MGREGELNHNTASVWRLSKGHTTNILGTDWCVKLEPTGLVLWDVEITKRKYSHTDATTSTDTATIINTSITTAKKAKATTISSIAITTIAAIKTKRITVKFRMS